jgi:hypothetical protein
VLTEEQLRVLERAQEENQENGEIETAYHGHLGAQNTYSKAAFAKLPTLPVVFA